MGPGYPKDKDESLELEQSLQDQMEKRDAAKKEKASLEHDAGLTAASHRVRALAMNTTIGEHEFAAILEDLHTMETSRFGETPDERYDFGVIMHRAIIGA